MFKVLMVPATRGYCCCIPLRGGKTVAMMNFLGAALDAVARIEDFRPAKDVECVGANADEVVWLQSEFDVMDYLPERYEDALERVNQGHDSIIEVTEAQWKKFQEHDGGEFSDRDARKQIRCDGTNVCWTMTWDDEWDELHMVFSLETEPVEVEFLEVATREK